MGQYIAFATSYLLLYTQRSGVENTDGITLINCLRFMTTKAQISNVNTRPRAFVTVVNFALRDALYQVYSFFPRYCYLLG